MSPATPRPTLWRHSDFLKLWSAQSISLMGSQVTAFALPLTAVLWLHASPFQVGVLASLQYLPFLLVSLPAGALIDRVRRLPWLIAADLARAALLITVPGAAWLGHLHLALLYPVAFLVGVLTVVFDVAHQSYLPSLVTSGQIVEGNTKLQLSYSSAQLAGPGLGGLLVQWLTAPIAIAVDAVSYLGSAVLLLLIHKPEPEPAEHSGRPRSLGADIHAGLRFVLRHPLIRPIALATGTSNFFYLFGMTGALLVIYAVRELKLTPALLGLVLVLGNAGAVLGSLASKRVLQRWPLGRVMVAGSVASAFAVMLMALARPATAVPLLAAAVLVGEFGITIYDISQISLRQAATPSELLGRMNATVRFINWGPIPIGAFVGGILGQALGLRPALWIAAAGSLLPAVPLLLSKVRTLRDISSALTGTSDVAATEPMPGLSAEVPADQPATTVDSSSGASLE